jgi:hypothetical protein
MNSYLEMILMAVCGRIGTPGGNVFNGHLMPMGPHSDERDPKTWRTEKTGIPAIMGYFPPNVIPEEILSQKDDRLRAMIISGANPLRSYADTLAYEEAFKKLDLLVTIEIAMTETAGLVITCFRQGQPLRNGTPLSLASPFRKHTFNSGSPVVRPGESPWRRETYIRAWPMP